MDAFTISLAFTVFNPDSAPSLFIAPPEPLKAMLSFPDSSSDDTVCIGHCFGFYAQDPVSKVLQPFTFGTPFSIVANPSNDGVYHQFVDAIYAEAQYIFRESQKLEESKPDEAN